MTTVVLVQQGGTGSNNAADARGALGAAPSAAYDQANSAFAQANSAYTAANTGGSSAGAAYNQANAAYGQANTATTIGQNAYGQANLAYAAANNSNLLSGGLISGTLNVTNDMIVGGNIYLQGNTTFINVATYQVNDPLMYIAANNILTDSVDIGFVGAKNTSGVFSHTGLARDATDGKYKLFDNLADSGHVGNVIDFANSTFATLVANVEANNITIGGSLVATQANLTLAHNQANNAYAAANNRVLKAGDTMTGNLIISAAAGAASGTFAGGVSLLRVQGSTSAFSEPRIDLGEQSLSPTAYIASKNEGNGGGSLIFGNRDTSSSSSALTERMRIGPTGNVGIGTNSPNSPLHIVTTNNVAPILRMETTGNSTNTAFWIEDQDANPAAKAIATMDLSAGLGLFNLYAGAYTLGGGNYYASTRGASRLTLTDASIATYVSASSTGTAGAAVTWYQTLSMSNSTFIVYTSNGTERMRVTAGLSVGTTADPGAGAIYATGDITAFYSDDRLKTKLGNIDSALSKVLSLNGFYFEPNETAMNLGYEKKKQVGVSAQEVQAVLPEVVVPAPIDQEYMTVHYHKIVPLLIEAIKELNEKIEKLTK